ncbi:MAG: hypothetical protein ABIR84_13555 [Candidatus Nitrotoga sp.]
MKKLICGMGYKLKRSIAAIILSIGILGCAGSGGSSASSEQVEPQKMVAELAAARWEALIKGDIAKAYTFLSPGTRDVMSLDLYKAKIRSGNWKKANVDSVSCEHDQCKASIAIEYGYRDIKSLETRLEENWLRQNGKWWYVPRK